MNKTSKLCATLFIMVIVLNVKAGNLVKNKLNLKVGAEENSLICYRSFPVAARVKKEVNTTIPSVGISSENSLDIPQEITKRICCKVLNNLKQRCN